MSTTKYSIDQIIHALQLVGINCHPIPHMSYGLNHSLSKSEFTQVVLEVLEKFEVKPQHKDWFPGTPTMDEADWGFYICPITPEQWEECDFDMCISMEQIQWC